MAGTETRVPKSGRCSMETKLRSFRRRSRSLPPMEGCGTRARWARIENKSGKKVASKKQRGWEYLKKLVQSPKAPSQKANEHEQEAFKKSFR